MNASNEFTKGGWMREKANSVVSRFTTRKSRKQLSKAYLKRQAEVNEKWRKRQPTSAELDAGLAYIVGLLTDNAGQKS